VGGLVTLLGSTLLVLPTLYTLFHPQAGQTSKIEQAIDAEPAAQTTSAG
jgi:hypothetical protein